MEDGELISYDSSLEWPGPDDLTNNPQPAAGPSRYAHNSSCTLRLLVDQSAILPKTQRIAVADGLSELQFGRDVPPPGSIIPRIRLKEMEVSKLHATACWDNARSEWTLLDMGSKHGTFHMHTNVDGSSVTRLSPPRVASMPRRLRHLDRFTIGSTAFIVHIHQDGLPCSECYPKDGEEIPLRAKPKEAESLKRKRDSNDTGPMEKDPRKVLNLLKRSLLSHHEPPPKEPVQSKTNWVDRSKRRRELHPEHKPIQSHDSLPTITPSPAPIYTSLPPPSPPPMPPAVPLPISSTNVGHRMLQKQGWTPGTSLGQSIEGEESPHRVEPIDVNANIGRSGLGLAPPKTEEPPERSSDWRSEGKKRRWSRLQP